MELLVYNGEIFQRSKKRFVRFGLIFVAVLVISILNNNITGAIIIFILLGGYFYYSININKKIKIIIGENGVTTGEKVHPRNMIQGFLLEIERDNGKIKNIVFMINKIHNIHTIADSIDNLKSFVENLSKFSPILENYEQSKIEKISRKLKL